MGKTVKSFRMALEGEVYYIADTELSQNSLI